ncbi:MAG: 4Fe-4S dicluster domain-containing protein [Candidatus Thermoplasmatota archaeon]|nr:4Fe-4S dicluster domain-containing protein [Candidatus Thermoplasmatota archaeon]MDI6856682.1 4Fe-4S dicluster domain-containing protein [Candidatus Thermoplasmatota archaeon]MDI6887308.1 4Fe-4S dicluster domain-containing protein [Candidatus Thermoplasmatota archaeon]
MIKIGAKKLENPILAKVEELSGQNLFTCYFCGTCSASCPFSLAMDIAPDKVIRYLQFGKSEILSAKTPWVCSACFTCAVRCPRNLDIAKIMEALRLLKIRKNIDITKLESLSDEELEELPQLALVSNFRKKTG